MSWSPCRKRDQDVASGVRTSPGFLLGVFEVFALRLVVDRFRGLARLLARLVGLREASCRASILLIRALAALAFVGHRVSPRACARGCCGRHSVEATARSVPPRA